MDEELEFTIEEDTGEDIFEAMWLPSNNEEALRWEVLKLATSLTTHDKAIKLAGDFEAFIKDGLKIKVIK